MINIKFCKKCKRAYDYKVCPYCRQKELKLKEVRKDGFNRPSKM